MDSAEPAALPDERVLEMAAIKLAELTGKKWRVEPEPLLEGRGTRVSGSGRAIVTATVIST